MLSIGTDARPRARCAPPTTRASIAMSSIARTTRGRDDASTARAKGVDEETALPLWTRFLCELRGELSAESIAVRSHTWREIDIVSSLVRKVAGRTTGTVKIGRVFTAANERGLRGARGRGDGRFRR